MKLLAVVGATAFAFSSLAAQTPPAPERLITNVRVFDGKNAKLSAPTSVLIKGNVIAVIGSEAKSNTATVINGGGRTLMPSLIDNHVHITMSAWGMEALVQDGITGAIL